MLCSISIESRADSTYGPWKSESISFPVYGGMACTSNVSGRKTFSANVSGSSTAYPGLVSGHAYQMSTSFKVSWSEHKHEKDFLYGSNITESEGSGTVSVSTGSSIFSYNGNNNPVFNASFPLSVAATAVNIGTSSYPVYLINGRVNCQWTVTVEYQYREVFNATTGQKLDTIDDSIQQGNKIAEDTNQVTKNIFQRITEFFGSFFSNLINAVVSLFMPSSDEFNDFFTRLNAFFEDHFGFLFAPFKYFNMLITWTFTNDGLATSTALTFPGFSIMGYEVWPSMTYDLASDPLVGTICGHVRKVTGILLAVYFVTFIQNFFRERFGTS